MTTSKYQHLEPGWVFFGGTFDPLHLGHVEAVRIARDRFQGAEIVLVPSFAPPVSKDELKTVHASFADRVAMCVVAFDEWERVQVSALEEDLEAPSFTVKTLRDLRAEYPTSRLSWMIGADQLSSFSKWHEPKAILELASLIVVPRPGQSTADLIVRSAELATSLGFKVSIDREAGVVLLDGAGVIFVLNEAPLDVSSTDVRAKLLKGPDAVAGLVPDQVIAYIEDLELYR